MTSVHMSLLINSSAQSNTGNQARNRADNKHARLRYSPGNALSVLLCSAHFHTFLHTNSRRRLATFILTLTCELFSHHSALILWSELTSPLSNVVLTGSPKKLNRLFCRPIVREIAQDYSEEFFLQSCRPELVNLRVGETSVKHVEL